jgi:hypothetical protein
MTDNVVRLDDVPSAGSDLEDYVGALFQSAGYFVEKNLVERDPEDVLELDIVATDYTTGRPVSVLAEAKGGKWGYPDIFKVVGWMRYLGQPRGAFFIKSAEKDIERVQSRIASIDVTLVNLGDFSDPIGAFKDADLELGVAPGADKVALWRFSNSVERRLAKKILVNAKSNPEREGPRTVLEYQRLVNDGIFFSRSYQTTMTLLYDAYQSHPRLTLASALEMDGKSFDPYTSGKTSELIREAYQEGKHKFLQACMYVEHRARLALLRAAVNLCCEYPQEVDDYFSNPSISAADSHVQFGELPTSFREGLRWLRVQPTFHRYGLFWQQLLWGWGGFYIEDRKDVEFDYMSKYCGIPASEIPTALDAFDRFFPISQSSWWSTSQYHGMQILKLVPMVFQGIGAHSRRQEYELADYTSFDGAPYTASNLARWNNCTVEFLA